MIGKNLISIIIILIIISATSIIITKNRHKDIVIKVDDKEYIVDSYNLNNNCITFNYQNENITFCDDFEIIE